jgi:hypothetical protein
MRGRNGAVIGSAASADSAFGVFSASKTVNLWSLSVMVSMAVRLERAGCSSVSVNANRDLASFGSLHAIPSRLRLDVVQKWLTAS